MNYFDDEANVQTYIKLAEGFDGKEFVDNLYRAAIRERKGAG